MSATEIRELALQLSPDERTVLAHDLLASVERSASGSQMPASASAEVVPQVVAITSQLFQSPVAVKESCDPEFPGEKYIVFVTEASAEPATILDLETQWNRQVTQRFPGWHGFRLAVRRKK